MTSKRTEYDASFKLEVARMVVELGAAIRLALTIVPCFRNKPYASSCCLIKPNSSPASWFASSR